MNTVYEWIEDLQGKESAVTKATYKHASSPSLPLLLHLLSPLSLTGHGGF